ncbi:MAG: hypothetical protein AB7F89_02050 [Pirellulaceae bacterium]
MQDPVTPLAIYLHLARASDLRRRPHVRDRLLVLAAVAATKAGLPRIAAFCRQRVLQHNPQHLLQRWPTVAYALRDADFLRFFANLEKRYSQEHAEQLLQSLGIEMGRERATYYSDEEYAAAIAGTTLSELDARFPPDPA